MYRACFIVLLFAMGIASQTYWLDFLLTPDQQGYLAFQQEKYGFAAERFENSQSKASAFYRAGEYKSAAQYYAYTSDSQSLYNRANAMMMVGEYAESIPYYEQALDLQPGWQDAIQNLKIARFKAKELEDKGGKGVGKLGADEIVSGKKENFSNKESDKVMIDKAFQQAAWLKSVQRTPDVFLRAKFFIEHQASQGSGDLSAGEEG